MMKCPLAWLHGWPTQSNKDSLGLNGEQPRGDSRCYLSRFGVPDEPKSPQAPVAGALLASSFDYFLPAKKEMNEESSPRWGTERSSVPVVRAESGNPLTVTVIGFATLGVAARLGNIGDSGATVGLGGIVTTLAKVGNLGRGFFTGIGDWGAVCSRPAAELLPHRWQSALVTT